MNMLEIRDILNQDTPVLRSGSRSTSSGNSTSSSSDSGISPASSDGESGHTHVLKCEWEGCSREFEKAELLYHHLCQDHIGRKYKKNLQLNCHWGSCQVRTVKRDHITSHMRVHVPLTPYICTTCEKRFKRPQDLKKHVRVHMEDFQATRKKRGPKTGSIRKLRNAPCVSDGVVPVAPLSFKTSSLSGLPSVNSSISGSSTSSATSPSSSSHPYYPTTPESVWSLGASPVPANINQNQPLQSEWLHNRLRPLLPIPNTHKNIQVLDSWKNNVQNQSYDTLNYLQHFSSLLQNSGKPQRNTPSMESITYANGTSRDNLPPTRVMTQSFPNPVLPSISEMPSLVIPRHATMQTNTGFSQYYMPAPNYMSLQQRASLNEPKEDPLEGLLADLSLTEGSDEDDSWIDDLCEDPEMLIVIKDYLVCLLLEDDVQDDTAVNIMEDTLREPEVTFVQLPKYPEIVV